MEMFPVYGTGQRRKGSNLFRKGRCDSRFTNQPGAASLNVVAVNQPLGLLDSFRIVGANNRFVSDKVSVDPYWIRPIFHHGPYFGGCSSPFNQPVA
jgi:hypothetical protein